MYEEIIEHFLGLLPDGQIRVKTMTVTLKDGVEVGRTNHSHVVDVGDNVTSEAQVVKDIAGVLHTPARIAARAIVREANQP